MSFAKIKDFFYDEYLKPKGYDLKWTRWVKEINDYWKNNLIPLGVKNEDELTIKLKGVKNQNKFVRNKTKRD